MKQLFKKAFVFLFALSSINFSSRKVDADSLNHHFIETSSTGFSVKETDSDALISFKTGNREIKPSDYFAITLSAIENLNTESSDPSWIYLQFSFRLDDVEVFKFDYDPAVASSNKNYSDNALRYVTSEENYLCPIKYYGDSGTCWVVIKKGFTGTLYFPFADFINTPFSYDTFSILSDGSTHLNYYKVFDIFLTSEAKAPSSGSLYDFESLSFDMDTFLITDSNLTSEYAEVYKNTTEVKKIVNAHVSQSRLTMLNVLRDKGETISSVISFKLPQSYSLRDCLIFNINNLLSVDVSFKIHLIDASNVSHSLKTESGVKYSATNSDSYSFDLTCDDTGVVLPKESLFNTVLIPYSAFEGDILTLKEIRFEIINSTYNIEIGKIIDSLNSETGDFKTIFNPYLYDSTQLDLVNPSQGSIVSTQNDGITFSFNDSSIYKIETDVNQNRGSIEYQIKGDYAEFIISLKDGFIIDKVFINGKEQESKQLDFKVMVLSDIKIVVSFRKATILTHTDDSSISVITYENGGDFITFKPICAKGYTVNSATFNDKPITLNDDLTYVVPSTLERYEFKITTRKVFFKINYIDVGANIHGSVQSRIENGRIYLLINPDDGYEIKAFKINGVESSFKGSIYSVDFSKDYIFAVKFGLNSSERGN